jgi:hypothetical protein
MLSGRADEQPTQIIAADYVVEVSDTVAQSLGNQRGG